MKLVSNLSASIIVHHSKTSFFAKLFVSVISDKWVVQDRRDPPEGHRDEDHGKVSLSLYVNKMLLTHWLPDFQSREPHTASRLRAF